MFPVQISYLCCLVLLLLFVVVVLIAEYVLEHTRRQGSVTQSFFFLNKFPVHFHWLHCALLLLFQSWVTMGTEGGLTSPRAFGPHSHVIITTSSYGFEWQHGAFELLSQQSNNLAYPASPPPVCFIPFKVKPKPVQLQISMETTLLQIGFQFDYKSYWFICIREHYLLHLFQLEWFCLVFISPVKCICMEHKTIYIVREPTAQALFFPLFFLCWNGSFVCSFPLSNVYA